VVRLLASSYMTDAELVIDGGMIGRHKTPMEPKLTD
jgi:hypothetical protein